MCRKIREASPVFSELQMGTSQWRDEAGNLVLVSAHKDIKGDVACLQDKCKGRWAQVWAQRAAEKAAIKADLEAWRLEEQFAMVQIDDVIDDES